MLSSKTPSIAAADAAEAVPRGRLTLIDVREPAELRSGHIKGARNIPLADLGRRMSELEGGKTVAFVCHAGARSARATRAAQKAGVEAVNVSGGVTGWARAGLALTR